MGRDTLDIFRRSGTFLKLLDAFLKIFIDTTWGLTGDTFEFWKCWYIDHTFWNKKSIFLCSRKNRDMILLTRGQKRRSRGIVPTTVRNYSTYYITSRQSWKSKKSRTFVIKIPAQRPCESKNSMKSRKLCYQDSLRAAMRVKKSNEKVVHLSLNFLPSGHAGQKIQWKSSKFVINIPSERPCGAKNPMQK